jgi:hypothetical protein
MYSMFWTPFRLAWRRLAKRGVCDDLDGAEYRRCLAEWIEAGQPRWIQKFIRRVANRPPPSTSTRSS